MNKFLSTVAIAIGLIATTSVRAQQADIYPKPQNIAWGNEIAFANTASYTLDGEGDADAVALFKERFNTENSNIGNILCAIQPRLFFFNQRIRLAD